MPKRANIYDARTKMPHKPPYQAEFFSLSSSQLTSCAAQLAHCAHCAHSGARVRKKQHGKTNFLERFGIWEHSLICAY